jgi:hypothetical protein
MFCGPHGALAIGQPTDVLATTTADKYQSIQNVEARGRLRARTLDLPASDQALAGLDDSLFTSPLHGDEVFA